METGSETRADEAGRELVDYLRGRLDELVDACHATEPRALNWRAGPSRRDTLPALLLHLADVVEAGAAGAPVVISDELVAAFVADGVGQGLDVIEDVGTSYARIRRVVTQGIRRAGVQPSVSEIDAFHEALDMAALRTVATYGRLGIRLLASVDEITSGASAAHDVDALLERARETLLRAVHAIDVVDVYLRDDVAFERRGAPNHERGHGPRVAPPRGIVERAATAGAPLYGRVAADEVLIGAPAGHTFAAYAVPLESAGEIDGALLVATQGSFELAVDDRVLVRAVGARLAIMLGQHRSRAAAAESARRLAESEARLSSFIENVPAILFTKDLNGRYTMFNRAQVRGLGLRRADFMGRTDDEIFAPETARKLRFEDERVLRTGATTNAEQEMPGVRGTRPYQVVRFPLRDAGGRIVGVSGFALDATRRLRRDRAQEILDAASAALMGPLDVNAMLQALAAAGRRVGELCAIGLLDKDGVAIVATDAAAREQREVMASWRPFFPTDEAPPMIRDAVRLRRPVFAKTITAAFRAANETNPQVRKLFEVFHPCSLVTAPLLIGGESIGVLIVASAQRRFTRDDLRVATELARRGGMAIEAARLYKATQDAVRAREEFMSVAAHELRTPLAAMRLQVETTVRRGKDGTPSPALGPALDRVLLQVERITRLVDLLFDVARLTADTMELDRASMDLASVAGDVVRELEADALTAGCTVELVADGEIRGMWDPVRVTQVVRNLVGNAVTHAPRSHVVVTVKADDSHAEVVVDDNGPGIDAERADKIFDPFVKGGHGKGLGLGLYVTRRIAEAHGGTLTMRSSPGQGTTFTLSLPR